MVAQFLRLHPETVVVSSIATNPVTVANRDIKRRVGAQQNSSGEVPTGFPRVGDKDLLHVSQRRAL
jgi:hypothetical protein